MQSATPPTHRLWVKHSVALNAQQRAAVVELLRLCHIVPDPSTWTVQHAGGITFDQLAVSGKTEDVARAAQILQALQQFVYLSVPPVSIGKPTGGFPLPEVTLYRHDTAPGWTREGETGNQVMYMIGRCEHGLVVGQFPAAMLPLGAMLWHAEASSPEAAVAAWVQATIQQRPRVILTEPCAPGLWRFAYQI